MLAPCSGVSVSNADDCVQECNEVNEREIAARYFQSLFSFPLLIVILRLFCSLLSGVINSPGHVAC